jgi:cytosine/adenosine deaminase-related metal-dependent hydrolase
MRTRISGAWVVGFEDGDHVLYDDAAVVFEDDEVTHVGNCTDVPVDREIAGEYLVVPGMVNAHAHLDVAIGGFWHDRRREPNVYARRPDEWVHDPDERPAFTPGQIEAGARHSMLTLLQTGTTTFADLTTMVFKRWDDPVWEPHIYAEIAGELGLRATLSHRFRSSFIHADAGSDPELVWDEERGRRGFERARRFADRYDGAYDGRIETMLFPYTLDTVTKDLLAAAKRAADERETQVRIHAAQSVAEVDRLRERHDQTPVDFLDSVGLLDENVCLTHCLYPDGRYRDDGRPTPADETLDRIADSGATVIHCPLVYRREGGVLNSFGRYRDRGIDMALGTDTDPQNILEEMRWAALANKWVDADPAAGSARELFTTATLGGARALGRPDIGRLEPGGKADLVVVDLADIHIKPYRDPIVALVHCATPADVQHVFVDGDHLLVEGSVLDVDERRIIADAQSVYDDMERRFAEWQGCPADEDPFRASYPVDPTFDANR